MTGYYKWTTYNLKEQYNFSLGILNCVCTHKGDIIYVLDISGYLFKLTFLNNTLIYNYEKICESSLTKNPSILNVNFLNTSGDGRVIIISLPQNNNTNNSNLYISNNYGKSFDILNIDISNTYLFQSSLDMSGKTIALTFANNPNVYFSNDDGKSFNVIYSSKLLLANFISINISLDSELLCIFDYNIVYIYNFSTNTLINTLIYLPLESGLKLPYDGISCSNSCQYCHIPLYNSIPTNNKMIKFNTYETQEYELLKYSNEIIGTQGFLNRNNNTNGKILLLVSITSLQIPIVLSSIDGKNFITESFFSKSELNLYPGCYTNESSKQMAFITGGTNNENYDLLFIGILN